MGYIAKLLVLALTAVATPILRRDAVTVINDINENIGPQIQTLHSDVNSFPESGLSGAVAINSDVQTLVAVLDGTTSDINDAGSFSEADGTDILADVELLAPTLLDTLLAIRDQAEAWADIPGAQAVVLKDLQSLNTAFDGFANALIAAMPADIVPSAEAMKTEIDGGFTTAINAYS